MPSTAVTSAERLSVACIAARSIVSGNARRCHRRPSVVRRTMPLSPTIQQTSAVGDEPAVRRSVTPVAAVSQVAPPSDEVLDVAAIEQAPARAWIGRRDLSRRGVGLQTAKCWRRGGCRCRLGPWRHGHGFRRRIGSCRLSIGELPLFLVLRRILRLALGKLIDHGARLFLASGTALAEALGWRRRWSSRRLVARLGGLGLQHRRRLGRRRGTRRGYDHPQPNRRQACRQRDQPAGPKTPMPGNVGDREPGTGNRLSL